MMTADELAVSAHSAAEGTRATETEQSRRRRRAKGVRLCARYRSMWTALPKPLLAAPPLLPVGVLTRFFAIIMGTFITYIIQY
jgi:hypothetical protein